MHFFKKKFTRCEYKEKIQKSLISLTVYEINDTFSFLRELTDIWRTSMYWYVLHFGNKHTGLVPTCRHL